MVVSEIFPSFLIYFMVLVKECENPNIYENHYFWVLKVSSSMFLWKKVETIGTKHRLAQKYWEIPLDLVQWLDQRWRH